MYNLGPSNSPKTIRCIKPLSLQCENMLPQSNCRILLQIHLRKTDHLLLIEKCLKQAMQTHNAQLCSIVSSAAYKKFRIEYIKNAQDPIRNKPPDSPVFLSSDYFIVVHQNDTATLNQKIPCYDHLHAECEQTVFTTDNRKRKHE